MLGTDMIYFKITNWKKYNQNHKGKFRCVMISDRFLDDAKVRTLTATEKLLFLALLLAYSEQSHGDASVSTAVMVHRSGVRAPQMMYSLERLSGLQLLSFEINHPLIEEKERKEGMAELVLLQPTAPDGAVGKKPQKKSMIQISKAEDFGTMVAQQHWDNWGKLYDPEFMKGELVKMTTWLLNNPQKNRKSEKGLAQFVGNWFARGWDQWLNRQPSNKDGAANGKGIDYHSTTCGIADV